MALIGFRLAWLALVLFCPGWTLTLPDPGSGWPSGVIACSGLDPSPGCCVMIRGGPGCVWMGADHVFFFLLAQRLGATFRHLSDNIFFYGVSFSRGLNLGLIFNDAA